MARRYVKDGERLIGFVEMPDDIEPTPEERARIIHFLKTIQRQPTFTDILHEREKNDLKQKRRKH